MLWPQVLTTCLHLLRKANYLAFLILLSTSSTLSLPVWSFHWEASFLYFQSQNGKAEYGNTHIGTLTAPHLFFFNKERFPWQPSISLPQCFLLSKPLLLAKNDSFSASGGSLLYCIFPLRVFLHVDKDAGCLVYNQLLISQCLTIVLKTCLLNEQVRVSNLPFVCRTCEIHKHFEYLKTNLTKQFANSHMVVSSQELLRM